MSGALADNLHTGSRSEILSDYLFSAWGAVTPVRRQDDYGVDLYCTLTARQGQRALVHEYFVVQVKRGVDPWSFSDRAAIDRLIKHPAPLFLACVDKKRGLLSVYHVMPRFMIWAIDHNVERITLTPGDGDDGAFVEWRDNDSFSLSAPILRVGLADLIDEEKLNALRAVFEYWVRLDRENCVLVSSGLFRFRMPPMYRTNKLPSSGIGEIGCSLPDPTSLSRGVVVTAEAAECIGGQLRRLGDREAALYATLLVYHLRKHHEAAFKDLPRWSMMLPGDMGMVISRELNASVSKDSGSDYLYRGVETVARSIASLPELGRYFSDGGVTAAEEPA